MNEYDFLRIVSEVIKNSIDNNPNFDAWEKWYRKSGVEMTMHIAEEYYNQKK